MIGFPAYACVRKKCPMTTVTLDLPQDLYQLAQHTAQRSRQPIEQVLLDWIQPPNQDPPKQAGEGQDGARALQSALADLEQLTSAELIQVVRAALPPRDVARLQHLLALQQQRVLTTKEYNEAEQLVKQADFQTLRKAKALYLLKQRNAFPTDLPIPGV